MQLFKSIFSGDNGSGHTHYLQVASRNVVNIGHDPRYPVVQSTGKKLLICRLRKNYGGFKDLLAMQ